jgi:uncharacterized protein YjaG (DUF416 family)
LAIHLPFENLSRWQQIAFASALLERMLPNYQMFSESSQFGDYALLRNQLDLVWQWLDKNNQIKININAQLNKLEEQTPDPEAFDSFGVFPALDVCMAMMSLWQAIQDQEDEDYSNVGRLSQNSVNYYTELMLAQEMTDQDDSDTEITDAEIADHPLMQWEKATQNELFDFIKEAPENKESCQQLKNLALEEGLSNLGIEIS